MKKLLTTAAVFCLSLSALAATSQALIYQDGHFQTKEGRLVEGGFDCFREQGRAEFSFDKGEIRDFEYDSNQKEDLEVEGRFTKDGKFFRGEVSVEAHRDTKAGEKEKKEISLEGKLGADPVFAFAKELLTKERYEEPTWKTVSTWKLEEGSREEETKLSKKIDTKTEKETSHLYEVKKTEKKEVYSAGELVHSSSSSSSRTESQRKNY